MEGGEKSHPQRSGVGVGVGGGEFFICFRIRPPSSTSAAASASAAMRVRHSKSIRSPGRGRVPSSVPEISSSLSVRFRRNGSLKGAQSPMFPSGVQITGRKKGGALETAEPSSPKVTCIGQVRVRSKKKGKLNSKCPMVGSTSNRRDGGRGCFPEGKQGMFLRICQAFRSLGLALNCFVPCVGRSQCCSLARKAGEGKRCGKKTMARPGSSTTRGDEIAKWLPPCDDSQNVVREEREKMEMEMGFLLQEREEMVEMEVEEIGKRGGNREMAMVGVKEEDGEDQEAGRVSVCIPPKNALLLMRCRSDPVRMAAMANRFWGSQKEKEQSEEETLEEEEKMEKLDDSQRMEEDNQFAVAMMKTAEREEEGQMKDEGDEQNLQQPNQHKPEVEDEVGIAGKDLSCGSPPIGESNSSPKEVQKEETEGTHLPEEQEINKVARNRSHTLPDKKGGKEIRCSRPKDGLRKGSKEKDARRHSFSSERETVRQSSSSEREARRASFSADRGRRWSFSVEKEVSRSKNEKSPILLPPPEEKQEQHMEAGNETDRKKSAKETDEEEKDKKNKAGEKTDLPDCLLLMMYEPKLSMEVSQETWVCGNDFLRWRPHPTPNLRSTKHTCNGGFKVDCTSPEVVAAAVRLPAEAEIVVPSRPAAVVPYEPLMLTRCKSEPTRSTARLAPNAYFWNERHRPISAAAIGF